MKFLTIFTFEAYVWIGILCFIAFVILVTAIRVGFYILCDKFSDWFKRGGKKK